MGRDLGGTEDCVAVKIRTLVSSVTAVPARSVSPFLVINIRKQHEWG